MLFQTGGNEPCFAVRMIRRTPCFALRMDSGGYYHSGSNNAFPWFSECRQKPFSERFHLMRGVVATALERQAYICDHLDWVKPTQQMICAFR